MARHAQLLEHLAEVPLFATCSKRDLQTVARHAEVMDFADGAAVVRQGEAGNAFYVLVDGTAVVRRNGRKVADLHAGDFFGELALLDPAPRNADVVAVGDVVVARVLQGDFRRMLRDVPTMNERLLAGLARRLRDADRHAS
jgi:CRP-like cAMP-binding protein